LNLHIISKVRVGEDQGPLSGKKKFVCGFAPVILYLFACLFLPGRAQAQVSPPGLSQARVAV
jgi:hypothetical protein